MRVETPRQYELLVGRVPGRQLDDGLTFDDLQENFANLGDVVETAEINYSNFKRWFFALIDLNDD